mgnify:CR=1 FL=1
MKYNEQRIENKIAIGFSFPFNCSFSSFNIICTFVFDKKEEKFVLIATSSVEHVSTPVQMDRF